MATYFSTNMPGIQAADNMQTLYLMNPGFVGFPDAPAQGNIFMFGQHAGNQLPGNEQQFISIPMMAQPPAMGSHPSELSPAINAASNLRQHNLWRNNPSEFSFVQSINQTSPTTTNASSSGNQHHIPGIVADSGHQSVGEVPSQVGLRREQQGGLSLSLSSSPVQFMASTNSFRSDAPAAAAVLPSSAGGGGSGGEETGEERTVKWEGGLQSVLMGSKYLKAAQQLLDEVVNVGRGMKSQGDAKSTEKEGKTKKEPTAEDRGDVGSNQGSELSAADRQELQMKKAKLITMMEEVDQRYKQYRHQMQVVVSSFEAAAGAGAARAYTALALQTISKQFRCLRDAISGQIRLTNRSLGEEDGLGGSGKADVSRLRYIDHQLRQQRAFQQLGMVQNNAWRPQRGLPERSVSVLRAWLFEHFLHPYPKDADKVMLAKQTGLTRSQVSNWFINARVRLWKPMVEEMYMEEIKEQENEGKSEEIKPSKSAEANEDSAEMNPAETESPPAATQAINKSTKSQNEETTGKRSSPPSLSTATTAISSLGNLRNLTGLGLIMSPSSSDHAPSILDNDSLNQFTPKKIRNNGFHNLSPLPSVNTNTSITAEAPNAGGFVNRQGYDLAAAVAAAAAAATENGGSYGSYQMGDIGRYSHDSFAPRGSGVSLTLGLPHCDSLSLSGSQHACLSSPTMAMGRRHDLGSESSNGFCIQNPSAAAAASHPGNAYDTITMQGRKRFAAQLLPDFVI
ncbi:BEL1-like homeodomain protein 1 [Nymphaea colorata]|nr:BEL1-like homeodomain protein 1 [Nymphaea colorata]XP_031477689.1 BEL1-like homeodomain protein 1 [Nymphaea colorata]XP_031477696.1 BEL1-like homeodomain protein 1 [Nymphaea colorata]